MMLSEKETKSIRRFVCGELRDEPDLSTLTLRILKKRYLARVQCDSLSPEGKNYMKQVVEEELVKMQDNDKSGSEVETKKLQNKRKREKDNDEVISGEEDESTAKKSRRQSGSSSESEDKEDCKTGSEVSEEEEKIKSEDEEQEVKKSQQKKSGGRKPQTNNENSTDDEEKSESEKEESDCSDGPKEVVKKKASSTKNEETGKKTPQSDDENDTDTDNKSEKSDKITANGSSDDSDKEGKVPVEKKNSNSDSDSSSLPSLDDEKDGKREKTAKTPDDEEKEKEKKKKKKTVKKEESAKDQNNDHKAVTRLKRYISLCGVRRNYKKLLEGCRSVRSQVTALKKELEDLGVHGQPSIEKCKKVRKNREEAQEIAELDVSNIIATQGRPKRRGASAWREQHDPPPPSSPYLRTLDSGSDSDPENNAQRGRRKATDWSNLQGIISDDADSN